MSREFSPFDLFSSLSVGDETLAGETDSLWLYVRSSDEVS
jgi:hypothetical protein